MPPRFVNDFSFKLAVACSIDGTSSPEVLETGRAMRQTSLSSKSSIVSRVRMILASPSTTSTAAGRGTEL